MLYVKHVNWIFGRAITQKRLLREKSTKLFLCIFTHFNKFTDEMQEITKVDGEHKK